MDKEEYIFLNKKYENAVTAIKAHLFDVISNEEKKAMRIGLEMSREGISEEQYNKLQELAMKQGEDLGRVITLVSKLSDVLVRLDSYTKTLKELRQAKASTEEVEKSIQATAAEVIVGINETDANQATKEKIIENVNAIGEATNVEIPAVADAKVATDATPAPEVKVEETSTSEVKVEETPAPEVNETKTDEVPAPAVVEEATPAVVENAPAVEAPAPVEALPAVEAATEVKTETPTVDAPLIPVEATEAAPAVEAPAPAVVEAAPAANAPLIPVETTEAAPAVEAPAPAVVEAAPAADAPLIPVETTEAAPAVEAPAPAVVEAAPEASAPLIPVETTETVPVAETPAPAVVEAAPEASAPLIPVETTEAAPAVEAPAPAVVEVAPEASAPLIPVETTETVPVVETPAPAVVEAAPEASAPLIPVETTEAAPAVEAPAPAPVAPAVPEAAVVDNDTVPLIPLPEEVSVPTVEAPKEVVASAESTLLTNPVAPAVDTPSSVVDNPVEVPVEKQEEVKAPEKEVFTKNDANKARALLTSANQIGKLRKSLSTQEALLGARLQLGTPNATFNTNTQGTLENQLVQNGLLPEDPEAKKKQMEDMMNQANALYKEGKTTEAQALYDQISSMNKSIQDESSKSLSV